MNDLEKMSKKQIVVEFNDYLFTIKKKRQKEIIEFLSEMKVSVYEAFPKLVRALKKKFQWKTIRELKSRKIPEAKVILEFIFKNGKSKEIRYIALEALGLLDWVNHSEKDITSFQELLEIILEGYYDVYRFLAREIAFWHFSDDNKFNLFFGGLYFEKEDGKLMEPMLLKILDYSITAENDCHMDYKTAQITGMLRLRKAIPLLLKALKKIHYVNDGIYDEKKDWYSWFRMDSVQALGDITNNKSDAAIMKKVFLDVLQTDPSFDVVLQAIYELNVFPSEEIIPYLKGIRHRSIGQFVTKPNEIELAEAIEFSLKKRKALPENYLEYAAERIVFFRFETFDNNELTRFFRGFPVIIIQEFPNLFKKVVQEVVRYRENLSIITVSNLHLTNIAKILLHLDLHKLTSELIEEIGEISDDQMRTIAKQLLNRMKSERKKIINTDIAEIYKDERKYRMILTDITRKRIDHSLTSKNFQREINVIVKKFHSVEINENEFYERILEVLHKSTMIIIGENLQDLRPAAIVLIKLALQTCSFHDKKEKQEIIETIRDLIYIDDNSY